jgi:tetratricopeptide (TPR) repeat protein
MAHQKKFDFARSRLPGLIVLAALAVYALTLNHWMSLASLPAVSSIAAEGGAPPLNAPLHFLLTFPVRWLPAGWQMTVLNSIAAVCAALTLGLLARSVALLPQDRTREQRQRERNEFGLLSAWWAWVPPLFAALSCGLQLTFWEHATAATGDMLDLLLFAYVIRCLLEYRIDQRESWLTRSAVIYGIAATGNYAMIGFFPIYLAALVWIRGSSFFDFRFLARMFGWGTVGLTAYLLLPLLNALSENSGVSFWQALRFELGSQKSALLGFPRYLLWFAGLTSLLPLLLISIRWPSAFGETSPAGAIVTTLAFRIVHAALLAAGLWVVFGAPFAPRTLIDKLLQETDEPVSGTSFLTFYYLGAICLGYFAGYFLLIFGRETAKAWQKIAPITRLINRAVAAAAWMTVIAAPGGLIYKNLPVVRANNGSLLRQFATLTTLGLPARDVIAVSDDPFILAVTRKSLQETRPEHDPVLADTRLLSYGVYQQSLRQRFPKLWPALPAGEVQPTTLSSIYLLYEMTGLAQSNEVYYLHPSFGYYFEPLYLRPHGLVFQLVPYPTNAITPPALTDAAVQENQKFWSDARPALERLAALMGGKSIDARVLGRWYARTLDWWGVELQKLGKLAEAAQCFELARKLNPENVAAEINLSFNQVLRAGSSKPVVTNKTLDEKIDRYRTWNSLLTANGPVDEPRICFRLGETFAAQSLFRQAALQFTRVLQLEPDNSDARFWLANVFLAGQIPDKVLEITAELRARQTRQPLTSTNLAELTRLESMAYLVKGDTNRAENILLAARRENPQSDSILESLVQVYVRGNRLTNALASLEEQLQHHPTNVTVLLNKAYLCLRLEAYAEARAAVDAVLKNDPTNVQALLDQSAICIQTKSYKDALAPLNQILTLQPSNQVALINRAIANLQNDQLDAAQRDYAMLLKLAPASHQVHYGLGEIAFRRKDVPAAIKHYEAYLKFAPPDTAEAKQVAERLRQLKTSAGR